MNTMKSMIFEMYHEMKRLFTQEEMEFVVDELSMLVYNKTEADDHGKPN